MPTKRSKHFNEKIFIFIFCSLGLLSCFYLQKLTTVPSYLASALVGLVGSSLPKTKFYDADQAIACVYTGSFSAMCSLTFFSGYQVEVFILCLFTGCYFALLNPYFKGFGGKLGAIGFLSSLSFLFLKVIL